jgi:hypothetical protein
MSRLAQAFPDAVTRAGEESALPSPERLRDALDMAHEGDLQRLPFVGDDSTAGSEAELQASVEGCRETVDLPRVVAQSDFFANIVRRAAVGDTAVRAVNKLERFLDENRDGVWDNSWVRATGR